MILVGVITDHSLRRRNRRFGYNYNFQNFGNRHLVTQVDDIRNLVFLSTSCSSEFLFIRSPMYTQFFGIITAKLLACAINLAYKYGADKKKLLNF